MTKPSSPAAFRREVEWRLLDVSGVMEHVGLTDRRRVWERVAAGTLPQPIVIVPRAYALWDAVEIDRLTRNGKK